VEEAADLQCNETLAQDPFRLLVFIILWLSILIVLVAGLAAILKQTLTHKVYRCSARVRLYRPAVPVWMLWL
jgi:hypothetical protein